MKKILAGFVFVSLFFTTAYAAKAPDWVSGKSKRYSGARYLTGVGIASDLDGARSSARAEIAKIFKARVVQQTKDINSETTTVKDSKTVSSSQVDSNVKTEVFTEEILEGVEVSETYFDKGKKTYYALATLDKNKVNARLSQKALEQEEAINSSLDQYKQASNKLDQLKNLNRALDAIIVEKEILARKRVVEPVQSQDTGLSGVYAETLKNKREILDKILFVVHQDNKFPESSASVMSKITELGYKVKSPALDEDLQGLSVIDVKYGISVSPVDRNNPQWQFYSWQVNLEMSDRNDNGKILAAGSDKGEVSHLTEDTARNKAITAASEAAALVLEKQMNQFFYEKTEVK